MTNEEAIQRLKKEINEYTPYAKKWNEARLDIEALNMAIQAMSQELCEDEYIKVPKKALKYRTTGMVAYNVEWLKEHFDIERAVICGVQEPKTGHWIMKHRNVNKIEYHTGEDILTGEIHTVQELIRYETDEPYCSECGKRTDDITQDFCGYCGVRIREDGE